ncbi:MAG: thioredoxin [Actinomycetota bacterium]|nr:thioredoxin [Actinomycetota bacterium]
MATTDDTTDRTSGVRTLDRHTFDETIAASEVPVLVDFTAEWCPPCKMLEPVLDEIAASHAGRLVVVRVDVDTEPALAQRFDVLSMPTLVLLDGTTAVERMVGARPGRKIVEAIEPHLPASPR